MPFFHARSSRYRHVSEPWRLAATVGVVLHATLVLPMLAVVEGATAVGGRGLPVVATLAVVLGAYVLVLPPAYLWARREDLAGPELLSPIGVAGVSAALAGVGLLGTVAVFVTDAPLVLLAASLDFALLGALGIAPGVPFDRGAVMLVEEAEPDATLVLPRGEPHVFAWSLDDPLGIAASHAGSAFELRVHFSRARYRRACALPRERTAPSDLLRLAGLDRNPELRRTAVAIMERSWEAALGPMQAVLNVCAFATSLRRVAGEDARGRPVGTVLRSPTEVLVEREGELLDLCLLTYRLLTETGEHPELFWRASPLGGLDGRIALGLRSPAPLPAITVTDAHTALPYLLFSPEPREPPTAGRWRWRLLDAEDAPGFRRIVP